MLNRQKNHVSIMVNGEQRDVADAITAQELLTSLKLDPAKVALERNREIVPRSA